MLSPLHARPMPPGLEALGELAIDLRWTWSHGSDALWQIVDSESWELTQNPWVILQSLTQRRLEELADDTAFRLELARVAESRAAYMNDIGWYGRAHPDNPIHVAYFSMEFGLGEALPLYAGGLGVLAGDFLKTASDLGVSMVGIGLLFHEGYFRQMVDAQGRQSEAYPYNDPINLPIFPVRDADGGWLRVMLDLPGRKLRLRLWQAQVGRSSLFLLDSNDPLNSPADRGITSKLYDADPSRRLLQEMALGIGGWRAIDALGLEIDVCHINEGHAAFAVLERARSFMESSGVAFEEAFWATRAGNISTTHTPVAAGFDRFAPEAIVRYFSDYAEQLQITVGDLIRLGRTIPTDESEPFTMPVLVGRGAGWINAVSQLHRDVSRRLVSRFFPRWPNDEIPIDYVTNGVHAPSWDSPWADDLWTRTCGKQRWLGTLETICDDFCCASDEDIWAIRERAREHLVEFARDRLHRQLGERGADPEEIERSFMALDPRVLTLGFARRFASYKRPTLMLHDPERLTRLLVDFKRPVQIVVAGKAHPADSEGKELIAMVTAFARRTEVRTRFVFLEDYDMALAQHLVQGVDLWINTPRRPWEACGTSGMKVLVNGGLNLSELDGWWAEAYQPGLGWALGDRAEHGADPAWDEMEAHELYRLLEQEIVPEFYDRDSSGIPRAWVARIRRSMSTLTPQFSSNRMLREYVERAYIGAAAGWRRRKADGAKIARVLNAWNARVRRGWDRVRFEDLSIETDANAHHFHVRIALHEIAPEEVRLELYAERLDGGDPVRIEMRCAGRVEGPQNRYQYEGDAPISRPAAHYTPRAMPFHPEARLPLENPMILWMR